MRTELLTNGAALQRLREPWHELHTQASGTIFQTFDWLSSWWTVYGSRFGLRILALWQDGNLAGLVPCFIDRNALGAYARSMGEHAVFGAYAPLIRPEAIQECSAPTAEFFERLLRVDRCGFIDFHHVPSQSPFFDRLGPALHERRCLNVTSERSLPRLVARLPSTWETYVSSLTSHERHFARMIARLEQQSSPPFVVRVRRDAGALDDLIRLHYHVWAARGQEGYFMGRAGFQNFFRTLLPGLLAREAARRGSPATRSSRKGSEAQREGRSWACSQSAHSGIPAGFSGTSVQSGATGQSDRLSRALRRDNTP